jgi:hypothetical protein
MVKKTGKDFAQSYYEGKITEPLRIFKYTNLFRSLLSTNKNVDKKYVKKEIDKLIKENKLKIISQLKLEPLTEARLYIALYELTLALALSSPLLRKYNKEITTKRKTTINRMKKTLEYP